jgi:recombinational DNA repair ATPase RecF
MAAKDSKQSLRIIEFQAKAVKALKAVSIKPGDKSIVKLTGKNRQGKSSILDAIWMGLGGKGCIPSKPIRDGEETGEVFLDLGEFTVTRKITSNGEYLQVQNKEGFKASKPQEFLSSKLGNRARNPLEFMRLRPDEQVKALQDMVKIEVDPEKFVEITGLPAKGIDFEHNPVTVLDQAYKHLFERRTDANRKVKDLEGALKSISAQIPPGKDQTEPVSVQELFEERKALEAKKKSNDKQREAVARDEAKLSDMQKLLEDIHRERLDIQARLITLEEQWKGLHEEYQQMEGELATSRSALEQLTDPDFTDIDSRITAADETNRIANLVKQHTEASTAHSEASEYSQSLSDSLTNLKVYKTELIQAAGLPVAGLGFDNGEVTYNNIPLSQASTREQIEVSCGICAAENPEIGILTVDIGFAELDRSGQEALLNFAKEKDLQVWVTKVAEEPEADGFHIYEGSLVAVDGVPVEARSECEKPG